jgi:hypothetical protein
MSFQQVSLKALSRVRLYTYQQKKACIRQLPRRWATTHTTKSLAKKPNGPPKKLQNATNFTTATMDFQHSAILQSSRSGMAKPTVESLKTLFVASAIPMVGFGFSKSVLEPLQLPYLSLVATVLHMLLTMDSSCITSLSLLPTNQQWTTLS